MFGSLCYRHIPNVKRKNLQDKSEPMILVGYHPTGAYMLYNPIKHKIEVNRDVIVYEANSWN